MTAHPTRNWRTRMHAECAGWLGRWNLPADGIGMLTPDQLLEMLKQSYCAGYEDGRRPAPRKKP